MTTQEHDLVMHIGHDEIVIRQRYQMISIVNDVLIGLWFLIGSFMFFSDELMFAGTCLFVLGSVEMLIRPVIRFARHIHLQKYRGPGSRATDSSFDY